ncbi:MAG TPA: choice-of-anchor tandem repeat GloVer-containing protein, partial [Candidatus Sulfotelmatobacter sp.]|nr:choice-of-anchor tandem repeat GloVer-containing protein [Candidatus Sulfotelmatobacter sp.]
GDGQYPFGSLVFDKQGNLYGSASSGGGSSNSGIVFELSPSSSGEWSETVIHNFNDSATDGAGPSAALIFDSTGNLYSTTIGGGSEGRGTVFELSPAGGGTWTETILYSFSSQGSDGYSPNGDLILDKAGNLYGVTASGGQSQDGAVFEVTP